MNLGLRLGSPVFGGATRTYTRGSLLFPRKWFYVIVERDFLHHNKIIKENTVIAVWERTLALTMKKYINRFGDNYKEFCSRRPDTERYPVELEIDFN